MFRNEGKRKSQKSPISPALFPHCMEKEGAKQNQNTILSKRCPLRPQAREGAIRRFVSGVSQNHLLLQCVGVDDVLEFILL
jgi:hypothetical protein